MPLFGASDTTANKPQNLTTAEKADTYGITAVEIGTDTSDNVVAISVTGATQANYVNGNAFSVSGGGGSGLAGTINVTAGTITSVTITNGGTAYTSVPTVTAPTGTGATLTASLGEGTANSAGITHTGWNKRTVGTGGRAGRVFWETLIAGGMAHGAGDEDIATPGN